MSPRDRLDGIKTKKGRVVYDREKHPWTEKDLRRILKKVTPASGYEIITCEEEAEVAESLRKLYSLQLEKLRRAQCGYFWDEALRLLYVLYNRYAVTAEDQSEEYGGGEFGGGGASRPY